MILGKRGEGEDAAVCRQMVISFDQLLAAGREYEVAHPGLFERELQEGQPQDVASLVYASGTTGPPKGAMLSHETILFTTTMVDREGKMKLQHQERRGIRANADETCVTKGDLPRIAGQEVQTNGDDDVDGG